MKKLVKNNTFWIGKIDWELRKFHGDEYSTHKGSSYNAYLVQEEKNIIIDTVWMPYAKSFVENLKSEIALNQIDAIVINHGEIDHSGSLPELMAHIPDTPIYCTANAVKSLKGHYHQDWNFKIVKTGDTLELGNGKQLIFIEAPMLHWPDTMMSYMTGDHILFSNDAFGQHYASEHLFNDLVDKGELFTEALKYYANILTPFSQLIPKKINEFVGLNVPLDIICTSHGVIWRDNPMQIIEHYLAWADHYQEDQITIIYDTMWNGTRLMAEAIANGILRKDKDVTIKLFNLSHSDKNDVVAEVFKSKTICLGSPTINRGILISLAALLEELRGLSFKNKKAIAFGSYGWSGESVKMINDGLVKAGFALINDGLKITWQPDETALAECIQLGETIAQSN